MKKKLLRIRLEDRGAIDSQLNFEANAANQNFSENLVSCFYPVKEDKVYKVVIYGKLIFQCRMLFTKSES